MRCLCVAVVLVETNSLVVCCRRCRRDRPGPRRIDSVGRSVGGSVGQ